MRSESVSLCVWLFVTHGLQPTRLLCLWNSPDKNTGAGGHFLLQGICLTQGPNPGLLHFSQTLYRLSYEGSPLQIVKRAKCDCTCTSFFMVTWLVFNKCSNKYMVVIISPLRNEEWRFVQLQWLLGVQSLNFSLLPPLIHFQIRELFGILLISTGILY